jgi:hypothetical protein
MDGCVVSSGELRGDLVGYAAQLADHHAPRH